MFSSSSGIMSKVWNLHHYCCSLQLLRKSISCKRLIPFSTKLRSICSESGMWNSSFIPVRHHNPLHCVKHTVHTYNNPAIHMYRLFTNVQRVCVSCYSTHASFSDISFNADHVQMFFKKIKNEYDDIQKDLLSESASITGSKLKNLHRRKLELLPIVDLLKKWEEKNVELEEINILLQDSNDNEMISLAKEEKLEMMAAIRELEDEIFSLLVPKDEDDDTSDVLVEISAGVGGQEAMLFAAEMFEMYQRYAHFQRWQFDVLDVGKSDIGGIRHATVSVSGPGVYSYMKYEGGVHRVQRVPKTEKQGRVHTSTMTVAVLPQPREIDLQIKPSDLKIETKRASGAGGQHVNTTDSAVRIVHLPTGIAAECQQERSQIKNKAMAMKVLETRLYNKQLEEQQHIQRQSRKLQVGSSGRSEKIRTYNFNQDRITDHRIGQHLHNIDGFLSGGDDLNDLIESLQEYYSVEAVKTLIQDYSQKSTISE
ncbi:peptide chain release factor 1-like, mitochondrial [Saccoglossus kowalevskii]|uniref:Peptide chain release factor 1-like, mitochondrial-like n=1 Tax=Saccoglossus kowalevskii TaxID=10224 RepID=A0ABM0MY83_SACKO|nr:PREDICTED: peptide chain release factor 1-like, mitochondrial-like [Saccoglossus kowalevskii]